MNESNNKNGEKLIINVELIGDSKKDFIYIKKRTRIVSNTDVIRWALAFAKTNCKFEETIKQ